MIADVTRCFSDITEPPGLLWLVMLIMTAVLAWRRKWSGALALGILALIETLMGCRLVSNSLLATLERPYIRSQVADLPACDAVVMLGGTHDISAHDVFGFALRDGADRVLTALELVRQGKGKTLVLGGAMETFEGKYQSSAVQLQKWFAAWGIPSVPVITLQGANDTHAEAERVQALAAEHHWQRLILVTSAYHMSRAKALFKKVGLTFWVAPCDYHACDVWNDDRPWTPVPRTINFRKLGIYLHEQFAWFLYRCKGWV